jgi:hypothetical protein
MNTDMKKQAPGHSRREWGRAKTKTLPAGLRREALKGQILV